MSGEPNPEPPATEGDTDTEAAPAPGSGPGWRPLALAGALYAAAAAVATYPTVVSLRASLPVGLDALVHIWTMRWYRTCLLQGRSPFVCPEVQYPVGAALGQLPPMHVQSLLFLPLSALTGNDVLSYNLIWLFHFVLAGLGTYLLAWRLLRDGRAAWFAGLAAMLGGPMMFFAGNELEQISVGWFPLFLVAWTRWVDRPTRGRLAAAAAGYLLLAMAAPYFLVMGTVPAAAYVAWQGGCAGAGTWPWLRRRLGGLLGFAALTLPPLAVLFSGQLWASAHGYVLVRGQEAFASPATSASAWGYLIPTPPRLLGAVIPPFYLADGVAGRVPSYLGAVTLGLIAYAAARRVRFPRGGYVWLTFLLLAVLSVGAYATFGPWRVPLPALGLRLWVPGFKALRVPARFNLLAAVCGAVVAGAGLRDLLGRLRRPAARRAALAGLSLAALADLAVVPFPRAPVPAVPACYAEVLRRDPSAAILDVPQLDGAVALSARGMFWQSSHGGTTVNGYTAFPNTRQEDLVARPSPFHAYQLARPDYLADPRRAAFDLARGVDFDDYAWLYLTAHAIDYVVVHHGPGAFPELPVRAGVGRLERRLAAAKVFEDAEAAVYARARLRPPGRPVALALEGFRDPVYRFGRTVRVTEQAARVALYRPPGSPPVRLTLDAAACRAARTVRLLDGPRELARWSVAPGACRRYASPPLDLPPGLHRLTLASDGQFRPARPGDAAVPGDPRPLSLWAAALAAEPAPSLALRPRAAR